MNYNTLLPEIKRASPEEMTAHYNHSRPITRKILSTKIFKKVFNAALTVSCN
jgi:hypothetical protein